MFQLFRWAQRALLPLAFATSVAAVVAAAASVVLALAVLATLVVAAATVLPLVVLATVVAWFIITGGFESRRY